MGRPKLVLPVGEESVIARVVRALIRGGADRVLVIAPPRDQPASPLLAEEAARAGAEVAHCPAATADMRATVEYGLGLLESRAAGASGEVPDAGILLAPGDSVGMTAPLVKAILGRFREDATRIVLPSCSGRRGHPLALPWDLARRIRELPPEVGINALIGAYASRVELVSWEDPGPLDDLDTPEDYRRWGPG